MLEPFGNVRPRVMAAIPLLAGTEPGLLMAFVFRDAFSMSQTRLFAPFHDLPNLT